MAVHSRVHNFNVKQLVFVVRLSSRIDELTGKFSFAGTLHVHTPTHTVVTMIVVSWSSLTARAIFGTVSSVQPTAPRFDPEPIQLHPSDSDTNKQTFPFLSDYPTQTSSIHIPEGIMQYEQYRSRDTIGCVRDIISITNRPVGIEALLIPLPHSNLVLFIDFQHKMPLTRRRTETKTTLRKGNLRNAAVLTLSQVTKLVNLPIAQDVARHIHHITIALKPSVLQAPKDNDLSAKELADHVAGLLVVLDAALSHLDDTADLDTLYGRLQTAHDELKSIQASEYTTKLASQTRIREQISQLKEEIYRTVLDLTLRLLVVTLVGNVRDRRALMRTQRATVRQQSALACAERRLDVSNKRIRELERVCDALQRQGSLHEAILMRYTDGRGMSYAVLALNGTLFFF
ncbi:hypothetical protein RSOLAG22IIIB_10034 [Rhizoctonia solani]|uniref:Uncharacterized protein n=1 Tax=Rhizoctonia solani TaxID=456999 RepID=A0A0K6G125_9AGAM|nr:hypothetical protein RSOLAG22IIIB_10034 [Rhizoctonia solani]